MFRRLRKIWRKRDQKPSTHSTQIITSSDATTDGLIHESRPPEESSIRFRDYPGRIVVDQPTLDFEAKMTDLDKYGHLPFSPDTIADGWSTDQFTVRAATVRGDSHRYTGLPRQDEFALAHHVKTGSLIVAVADGVSNAPESHLGARTVCRQAIASILDATDRGRKIDWQAVVQHCAWALVELTKRRMGNDADAAKAEEFYATTLTLILAKEESVGTAKVTTLSVGDSAAWLLRNKQLLSIAGGKATTTDDKPFASSVEALPRFPKRLDVVEHRISPGDAVLAMSDGIGDALGDGTGLIGDLLKSELQSPPPIIQFTRVTDFSRETFDDDRTLVGIWYVGGDRGGIIGA
jgi:serine/threonine protein phosphatase PrpC